MAVSIQKHIGATVPLGQCPEFPIRTFGCYMVHPFLSRTQRIYRRKASTGRIEAFQRFKHVNREAGGVDRDRDER